MSTGMAVRLESASLPHLACRAPPQTVMFYEQGGFFQFEYQCLVNLLSSSLGPLFVESSRPPGKNGTDHCNGAAILYIFNFWFKLLLVSPVLVLSCS